MTLATFRADALKLHFAIVFNFIEIEAVNFIAGRQPIFFKVLVNLI
jgi:hypothetical protein